jgi:hypothetical protein
MTIFGFGQTKFKEHTWEEVGLKFSVPNFVEITAQEEDRIQMESEDFLIYIDVVDEFDDLDYLIEYYKIKEVVSVDQNIQEPTYTGEAAAGFRKAKALGDNIDVLNVFGNLQSSINYRERVAFDISIYEWTPKTEALLNEIMGSIAFYDYTGKGNSEPSAKTGSLFSGGNKSDSTPAQQVAQQTTQQNTNEAAAPTKKRSFFSKLMDVAGPILTNAVPFGGVATGIINSLVE